MTFAVCVTFQIEAASFDAFLKLTLINAKISRESEPGCLRFDVLTDPHAPNEVFLYELYTDGMAFQAHLETSHFLEFDSMVKDMIANKVIKTYQEVVT